MPGAHVAVPRLPMWNGAEEIYSQLMKYPHVKGCFIGRKTIGGRSRRLSIVCCVDQKVAQGDLRPDERIPPTVSWSISAARSVSVHTDVVVLGRGELANGRPPIPGPGDQQSGIVITGPSVGLSTVGVALARAGSRPLITTAGHAVLPRRGIQEFTGRQPWTLELRNFAPPAPPSTFRARVIKAVWTRREDYALLRVPRALLGANIFRDRWPIGGSISPTERDIGQPVWALTTRGRIKVRLVGVGWSVLLDGRRVDGGVLTTRCWPRSTQCMWPGDSGCPLIDSSRRVIGLLHGFTQVENRQVWVFLPIANVLARESAFLA